MASTKDLIVGTKWNLTAIRDWQLIPTPDIAVMITNMMRIGMPDITPDIIHQVIKRTNLANECNLQIPFLTRIRPVTHEDIHRFLWLRTNINPTPPQKWYSMMRKMFPYLLDFDRLWAKAKKAGWVIDERPGLRSRPDSDELFAAWWLHNENHPEAVSSWLYPVNEYLTEKSVWQDAFMKGKI